MKNTFLFIIILCSLQNIFAQDNIPDLSFNSQDSVEIKRIEGLVNKANEIMLQVANFDQELTPMFEDRKQRDKAEKKSIDAKKLRIEAALLYWDAYNSRFEIVNSKIEKCEFASQEDEIKANKLKEMAEDKMKTIERKYKRYKDIKTGDLKDKRYKYVCRDLSYVTDTVTQVFKMQQNAYKICLAQKDKLIKKREEQRKQRQKELVEETIWKYTQVHKTWHAYNDYVEQFPSGKFIQFAKVVMDDYNEDEKGSPRIFRFFVLAERPKKGVDFKEKLKQICDGCTFSDFKQDEFNGFISKKSFNNIKDAVLFYMNFEKDKNIDFTFCLAAKQNNNQIFILKPVE